MPYSKEVNVPAFAELAVSGRSLVAYGIRLECDGENNFAVIFQPGVLSLYGLPRRSTLVKHFPPSRPHLTAVPDYYAEKIFQVGFNREDDILAIEVNRHYCETFWQSILRHCDVTKVMKNFDIVHTPGHYMREPGHSPVFWVPDKYYEKNVVYELHTEYSEQAEQERRSIGSGVADIEADLFLSHSVEFPVPSFGEVALAGNSIVAPGLRFDCLEHDFCHFHFQSEALSKFGLPPGRELQTSYVCVPWRAENDLERTARSLFVMGFDPRKPFATVALNRPALRDFWCKILTSEHIARVDEREDLKGKLFYQLHER